WARTLSSVRTTTDSAPGSRTCRRRTTRPPRAGARRGPGAGHHAARGGLHRRHRAESRDPCRVPDAPRPRGRRGRDEHRAGGPHRGAHGDEGARGIDHHRPMSPGRARADVGRAAHRGAAGRRARAHRLGGRGARASQLMTYPLFDPKLSADELEKQLLAAWKHERLFQKTQEAARYGPPFVFYEGPPTANGRPGIHHVFARTIKDLVCRYHTMLGQGVTRIAGWDT